MILIHDQENALINSDLVSYYQIVKSKESKGDHSVVAYMPNDAKLTMFTGPFNQCSAYMQLVAHDFGSINYHERIEELFYKSSIVDVKDEEPNDS